MTLTEYQQAANQTRSKSPLRLIYAIMGLCAQAGKIASLHRKAYLSEGKIGPDHIDRISKTLGDALWYIAETATTLQLDLQKIAHHNLEILRQTHT